MKGWENGEEGKEMKNRAIQFNKITFSFNLYLNELEITLEIQSNKKSLQFNYRALYICTMRERFNSFVTVVLCNRIREFSNSIKELSIAATTSAIWTNDGIKEISNSITELSN